MDKKVVFGVLRDMMTNEFNSILPRLADILQGREDIVNYLANGHKPITPEISVALTNMLKNTYSDIESISEISYGFDFKLAPAYTVTFTRKVKFAKNAEGVVNYDVYLPLEEYNAKKEAGLLKTEDTDYTDYTVDGTKEFTYSYDQRWV